MSAENPWKRNRKAGPFPGDSSLAFGMTRREGVRGIALARQNARVLLKGNKHFL